MRYTVVLIPEGGTGRYEAYVPALPGCVTFSDTIEDAVATAQDAARSVMAGRHEDGDDIPIESWLAPSSPRWRLTYPSSPPPSRPSAGGAGD